MGGNWAEQLQKVTKAYNETPHEHLANSAPNDVENKPDLIFHLRKQAVQDRMQNAELINARAKKLEDDGAFRVQELQKTFGRGFKPKFSDTVHQIARVAGDHVIDTEGKVFQTKFTQPVPTDSKPAASDPFARRGSEQTAKKQRAVMQIHAERLAETLAGGSMDRVRVLRFLGNDFKQATRLARLNQKSPLNNFLKLFPERFELNRNMVRAVAPPEPQKVFRRLRRIGPIDNFIKVA